MIEMFKSHLKTFNFSTPFFIIVWIYYKTIDNFETPWVLNHDFQVSQKSLLNVARAHIIIWSCSMRADLLSKHVSRTIDENEGLSTHGPNWAWNLE